jgi:hypothetical protein
VSFLFAEQRINSPTERNSNQLVKGEHHFQTQIDGQSTFDIDIRDLLPSERDFTLQALRNCRPQPNGYKLSVFRGDITLAFLPKNLSGLQIAIMDEVVPRFIPTLLGSLRALTAFTIHEYGVWEEWDPYETLIRAS